MSRLQNTLFVSDNPYLGNTGFGNNIYQPVATPDADRPVKQMIWIYFLLLIFEGAMRKWLLPGLATPLLIIRDPLAIAILVMAWQRGKFPTNIYMMVMLFIGALAMVTTMFVGHGNLYVALYGLRTLVLHFPLIFIIGQIFTFDDVVDIGKATLWIALPMTVLVVLQFYSPQSAWVNRGVGGDMEGAGFNGGAMGYFRPPGTFSFTNGNTLFYSFLAPFVFYFWLNSKKVNRLLLIAATLCLFISIPISISRNLMAQVGLSLAFTILAIVRNPKYAGKVIYAAIACVAAIAILSQTSVFQTAMQVFTTRMDNASEDEGGLKGTLIDRFLGGMIGAVSQSTDQPFWGYGLGMGTNAGSMLLTGDRQFLIAEGEWGRIVGESGPLMGLAIIFIRLGLVIKLSLDAFRNLAKDNLLPWILLSFGIMVIAQGQWGQPTSQGFATLAGGLILAALQAKSAPVKTIITNQHAPVTSAVNY